VTGRNGLAAELRNSWSPAAIALTVLWAVLLNLPNVLALSAWPWIRAQSSLSGSATAFAAMAMDGTLATAAGAVVITVCLIALVARVRWFVALTLPFAVLVPAEAFYVVNYGEPSSAHVVGVLVEATPAELREFLAGRVVFALAGAALFVLACIVNVVWLWRRNPVWTHRSRNFVLASVGGTAVAATVPALFSAAPPARAHKPDEALLARNYVSERLYQYANIFPWGVPLRFVEYSGQRADIAAAAARLEAFRFGATVDAIHAPRNVVLVIGESARADRFGLNGYARDTTPRLAHLPNLVSFTDATSAAAATRGSVPFMLTRQTLGTSLIGAPAEKSIVAAFREAGFRTWWISNQMRVGAYDSQLAVFAEEADVARFLNPASFEKRGLYDGALVDEIGAALADPAANRMLVVHMLGSHWDYRRRYPDAFDVFRPSLLPGESWSIYDLPKATRIRNAYDNTIRYTDDVLARIVALLTASGEDSVLVYMSDHGQALFAGRCLVAGHGLMSATNFHVPLLIWLSPGYAQRAASTLDALRANRGKPVTAESLFPTLVELGGLRLPSDKHELSLANPSLVLQRRLVSIDTRRWLDYDHELAPVDCAASRGWAEAARR
jgi:glucan phosphoethanolaminetransferase (alkaline phosphatase superfamily)